MEQYGPLIPLLSSTPLALNGTAHRGKYVIKIRSVILNHSCKHLAHYVTHYSALKYAPRIKRNRSHSRRKPTLPPSRVSTFVTTSLIPLLGAKKKSLSTLGIKNSWKYEKDLIHLFNRKQIFMLISQSAKIFI